MQKKRVLPSIATKSLRFSKVRKQQKQTLVQFAVQPKNVSEYMLGLQRQHGNHFVQRIVMLSRLSGYNADWVSKRNRLTHKVSSMVQPQRQLAQSQTTSNPQQSGELSGNAWIARFPTSTSIADLRGTFQTNMQNFYQALLAARANVTISATYRPPERAYLMHWAYRIAREHYNPRQVPAKAGVNIRWWHGNLAASQQAAEAMVQGYNIAFRPALQSNHTRGTAIDMTISWHGALSIQEASGRLQIISNGPQNGTNISLHTVGRTYGVIKHPTDRPHWSHNGR